MCRFTKDRLHAEVSSIANRSSPSDNDPELQMLSPLHMHIHESCRRACRTKGNRIEKGISHDSTLDIRNSRFGDFCI
jgi:hypothetical protein